MLIDLFSRRSSIEDPGTALTAEALAMWLGSSHTATTGVKVSTTTAMQTSAVYGCVRILAETVASLPLIMYQRIGQGKERAPEHPLYSVLHDLPNPYMTAMEMRENLVGHLNLWGSAYCEVTRDGAGRVRELWPMRPDRVRIESEGGQLWLHYTMQTGEPLKLPYEQVWHLRAFGTERYAGMSVISQARDAIGLSLATEQYGSKFFANDSRPGGVLRHPGKLQPEAAKNLKSSWEASHSGLSNAQKVAVLEEGIEWQQIGIPPEDAQFLETRKFQVTEIARMFRVPPHMLADLDRATFSNIEHQSIEFVVHTIRPWLVRFEQSIYRDMLTDRERGEFFAEHLVDGLLRGDIQSRYQAYATGRQNGWLSANDIRALENQNPIENGDMYLVPLNMVPADQAGDWRSDGSGERSGEAPTDGSPSPPAAGMETRPTREGDSPSPRPSPLEGEGEGSREGAEGEGGTESRSYEARGSGGSAEGRRRIARAFRRLVEDATGRILRREQADVMRQAEKLLARGDIQGFLAWMEEFYREHPAFYEQYMRPAMTALADQIAQDAGAEIGQEGGLTPELERFIESYTRTAGEAYCGSNRGQLRLIVEAAEMEGGDPLEMLTTRFGEWTDRTPGKQAMIHTVRGSGAITKAVWIAGGVMALRWVAYGDSCPYCLALDGKVVSVTSSFLGKGEEFEPEGASAPLTVNWDVGHPPAHLGCDCGLAPG